MYGAMIVDPKEGWSPAQELVFVQSEFYLTPGENGVMLPDYKKMMTVNFMDHVVFNGYANQYVENPIPVKVGEPIRLFVVNAGPNVWSSFHVVGAIFDRAMSTPIRKTFSMGCNRSRSDLAMGRVSNSRLMSRAAMWQSTMRSATPPTAPSRSSTHRNNRVGRRVITADSPPPFHMEGKSVQTNSTLISLEDEYEDELLNVCADKHSKTLLKTDRLRLILITMNAGTTLRRHSAPGPVTIQPVSGRFTIAVEGGNTHTLKRNEVVAIKSGVPHSVAAGEDGAFLLSISWPEDRDIETQDLVHPAFAMHN